MKITPHSLPTLSRILRMSLTLSFGITTLPAALYNVDFNGGAGDPPNATYSGAAVTGAAGDFWNGFNSGSGSGSKNLSASVPGSPTITMMFPAMGAQYTNNSANAFSSTGFVQLMGGHAFLTNPTAAPILTLGGFVPNSSFNLWIYAVGDPDNGKGGAFSVNGSTVQTNLIADVSSFENGNNYLQFSGTTNGSGRIILSGNINSGNEYLLNGFQVQGTPGSLPTVGVPLFNVDFNGGNFSTANPTHSGPAVTGAAGDTWNGFDTSSGVGPHPLVDGNGSASNIEMTFDQMATIYWAGPTDLFDGKPYEDLMSAFASIQNGGTGVATLTGFTPSSPYSLWVYTGGDAQSTGGGATWNVNGGATQVNLFDASTSDFTLGNNYLVFTGDTSATGEIILSGTENGVEGFLNGLQVKATPAPAPSFTITAVTRAVNGSVNLTFPTENGKNYTIESSPVLTAGSWVDTMVGTLGTGSPQTLTVPVQGVGSKWFFRVRKLGVSPAVPGNPVASAPTSTTGLLTWTDVGGETGYEVQWADNAGFTAANSLPPVMANATSATISGLTPNTPYFFRVRAVKTGAIPSDYAVAEATTPVANSFPVVSIGGITDASSEPYPGEEAIKGTDGLSNTKWLGNMTAEGAWLAYTFADNLSYKIKGFKITTANDNPGRHPRDFLLQGSTDGGTTWVDIIDSAFTGQTAGVPFITKEYNCPANTVAYPRVRLLISANNGDANTGLGGLGLVQLAEWQLLGE